MYHVILGYTDPPPDTPPPTDPPTNPPTKAPFDNPTGIYVHISKLTMNAYLQCMHIYFVCNCHIIQVITCTCVYILYSIVLYSQFFLLKFIFSLKAKRRNNE